MKFPAPVVRNNEIIASHILHENAPSQTDPVFFISKNYSGELPVKNRWLRTSRETHSMDSPKILMVNYESLKKFTRGFYTHAGELARNSMDSLKTWARNSTGSEQ